MGQFRPLSVTTQQHRPVLPADSSPNEEASQRGTRDSRDWVSWESEASSSCSRLSEPFDRRSSCRSSFQDDRSEEMNLVRVDESQVLDVDDTPTSPGSCRPLDESILMELGPSGYFAEATPGVPVRRSFRSHRYGRPDSQSSSSFRSSRSATGSSSATRDTFFEVGSSEATRSPLECAEPARPTFEGGRKIAAPT